MPTSSAARVDERCGLTVTGLQIHDRPPIDLAIPCGECCSLSGSSGSGKTLLLRALADLDPHVGMVGLNGDRAVDMPPVVWRRKVGMLPADNPWWFDRVGDHFSDAPGRLLSVLGFDGDVLEWQTERLSSGERQRLAVARLLALEPEALLLDEPTANLDPENTARVEQLVAGYRQRRHAPVLWVSHDPQQRQRVAERQLRLTANGLIEELP